MPIWLKACNTCSKEGNFAQSLVKILDTPVFAPDNFVWCGENGTIGPAGKSGDRMNMQDIGSYFPFSLESKNNGSQEIFNGVDHCCQHRNLDLGGSILG